ncbi:MULTISPECIES: endonuclease III [Enterococcus]|uniref:Endonuclease III n=1 Tax=Enterococcus mundtii TaxID=53346 RepID=A0A1A6G6I9_ENTMU|nr:MULTISPECIES: endonuclease III [Enterococcus]EOH61666.1 endonuclease III [Enterococcus mundtii ATCC 882]EOU12550.1 endonuclease III [Enterococcus mundtii ATCC 882]MBE9911505.1 endonuclease III [Enterococcus mundtii]MCA6775551.1 endonuclease III [Enterococcus mundtii]NMP59707.1 endonuclease III [Enterococcus mundtii]
MLGKQRTMEAFEKMYEMFPEAHGELQHKNPYELLIAVILSAQATDVSVNKATPALFQAFPTPEALAKAPLEEIIPKIKTIGLYRNKAKNIKACAQQLIDHFEGQVPQTREELVSLPGVGRKTANVVLGDAFGVPAIAVDTHVERVTKRLRICKLDASVQEVEQTLMKKVPENLWVKTHHTLIFFGRYHCTARSPRCEVCPLLDMCQDGKMRMKNPANKHLK